MIDNKTVFFIKADEALKCFEKFVGLVNLAMSQERLGLVRCAQTKIVDGCLFNCCVSNDDHSAIYLPSPGLLAAISFLEENDINTASGQITWEQLAKADSVEVAGKVPD